MNPVRQLQVYKENQLVTADSGTVLLQLYDGAIDLLNRARGFLDQGNMAEKGKCLLRAHDIITEFQLALDFEVGGELAHDLNNLYWFMLDQITMANVKNDPKPLETTIALLSTLKRGWEEAVVVQRKKVAQGGA